MLLILSNALLEYVDWHLKACDYSSHHTWCAQQFY